MLEICNNLKAYWKHEIKGLKDRGDKNHVDENVSKHGTFLLQSITYLIITMSTYSGSLFPRTLTFYFILGV